MTRKYKKEKPQETTINMKTNVEMKIFKCFLTIKHNIKCQRRFYNIRLFRFVVIVKFIRTKVFDKSIGPSYNFIHKTLVFVHMFTAF